MYVHSQAENQEVEKQVDMAYRDWMQILLFISDWIEHGESAKQIAEHLHMQVNELTRQLRRMKKKGIPVPELVAEKPHRPIGVKRKPFTGRQKSDEYWTEVRNNVLQWLEEKVPREQIAKRIGIQIQSLSNRLYRWRKEGYPVPVAPRPRKDVTVHMQRGIQAESNRRARELRKAEKQRIWAQKQQEQHVVYRPARKVEKRLPDRHRDTTGMKYVKVNEKTLIQIPADKDPEIAVQEWKARHNKH